MDELASLRAALAAAQQQSTLNRLSERTCVDLLQQVIVSLTVSDAVHEFLHRSGSLPVGVIVCNNGKEFVTFDRLVEEVYREVRDALIVNLEELAPILGVQFKYVLEASKILEKTKKYKCALFNDQLLVSE